ncbi:MCM6 [Enterospora canceri]|uniref:DNA replication licensing factor MCM6 n=1 Tax=Enterospora canceri TaxID=1081671 RepID=A0A1Y1S9C6_9MICR|nr:MCM6 [Enterospora canceri]
MSNAIDLFHDYLHHSSSISDQIDGIILQNGQTFYCDLDSVTEFSPVLAQSIRLNYSKLAQSLQKTFDTFCTAQFDKTVALSFCNSGVRLRMRDLRTSEVGRLVSFTGTVTRTSQVKPELVRATFRCRMCQTAIPSIEQHCHFAEPLFCPNNLCTNRSHFSLLVEQCEFSNWQKISVQEQTNEIPKGSLPRGIEVVVRDELCEQIKSGAHVEFTGHAVCVPEAPRTQLGRSVALSELAGEGGRCGRKSAVSRELCFRLLFVAVAFRPCEPQETAADSDGLLAKMALVPSLYQKLANSLYPTVCGHQNIKSALLLMLVGGCAKKADISLRGDINVLLVGDPGTAKSQFLKQTSRLLGRGNYASGKGSSAAGLTAAVVRDESGDYTVDAGALMLSDRGLCCIDEFDKMTRRDQVAIHEAMEQQTISISKAGINATLNARCSVLAAANPIRGRYDTRKTLRANVNLSPAIMSRFDLYFVLIDKIDRAADQEISRYILEVNSGGSNGSNNSNNNIASNGSSNNITSNGENGNTTTPFTFTIGEAVAYIKHVKNNRPRITSSARDALESRYIRIRQESLLNTSNYRMTVRHLESMIRLSEALAKIHNSDVTVEHVDEAYRLIKSSLVEIKAEGVLISNKLSKMHLSLSKKEYSKIVSMIVYCIKNEGGMNRGELVVEYLRQIEENVSSREELEEERHRAEEVIEFMMSSEGILYEMDEKIHIHPSCDI